MRALPILLLLAATFLPLASSASTDVWLGDTAEHDDYVGNPIAVVHASCDSTVSPTTVVHAAGTWHFAAANDCVGYEDDFDDATCVTDVDGTLRCSWSDFYGSHALSLASGGHVIADYVSFTLGDHFHLEGDLAHV